ncbi:cytidine deaminase-like protein [Trypanosoma grayi]|uniref:cytidine deaminase-like protein n=1 Tax=Trypanosoma grayi TaxID=71804 RepID=UPI0004F40FDF|nr:cytidine deaminase-like protein [Trypanosoma grayi]KEG10139.1 cytidine deaminase-like protein [Trypanosoma grayi]
MRSQFTKLNTVLPLAELPVELQKLAQSAVDAHHNAYCPYSNFAVGAALLHDDQKITAGCNYENCVYKGCCAEVCAIVKGNSQGHRTADAVAIYGCSKAPNAANPPPDTLTPPCGFCRQSLIEVADLSDNLDRFLVVLVTFDKKHAKVIKLSELVPLKFGPSNIGMDISKLAKGAQLKE